ncbi:MAG TPA: ABC transporter permease [Pirellulaceae bacterium]|nr:ABC transporter permease [Pirellulaceae bacterium]
MKHRHEIVLVLLLIALMVSVGWLMPTFVQSRSQLILSKHLWETAILAIGMTLIIITGGIDLSVGSAMGMCAVAFGICYQRTGSIALSSCVCIAVGTLGGATNGWLISRLRVHPLIITLATYAGFRGIAEGVSQGVSYSQFGDAFGRLAGEGPWFGLPIPAYIFIGLAVLTAIVLARTPVGRFIYAMGHNETAAKFSGVPVDGIKSWLYTISGLLAGVATLIYVSRFDSAKADVATGIELDVITAVVIGGTSILGGRGNIVGTCLGLLLIHETKLFVGRYYRVEELKSILVGLLLIGALLSQRLFVLKDRE